jgi:hypothetical protein
MARADQKVSSKPGGQRWGSRSWAERGGRLSGAEDEGGTLPGARGRFFMCAGRGEMGFETTVDCGVGFL